MIWRACICLGVHAPVPSVRLLCCFQLTLQAWQILLSPVTRCQGFGHILSALDAVTLLAVKRGQGHERCGARDVTTTLVCVCPLFGSLPEWGTSLGRKLGAGSESPAQEPRRAPRARRDVGHAARSMRLPRREGKRAEEGSG